MPCHQDEICEELQISRQTWRKWRSELPRLASRKGGKSRFTSGELLALKALHYLKRQHGVPFRKSAQVSDEIFDLCRYTHWDEITASVLAINTKSKTAELIDPSNEEEVFKAFSVTIYLVPIGELLVELKDNIHRDYEPASLQKATRHEDHRAEPCYR
ncbi:hypothetical protein [Salinisphaera hydrothermalis]|uniref:hypothetical protein n=1 Tax=Salinisphaera hydrothermalis TaxID=563188 RepID=UPI00333E9965